MAEYGATRTNQSRFVVTKLAVHRHILDRLRLSTLAFRSSTNLNMINLRFLGKSPRITIGPSFSRVGTRAAGINSRAVRAGRLGARLNRERDDVEAVIRAVVSRTGWCLPCCAAEDLNRRPISWSLRRAVGL